VPSVRAPLEHISLRNTYLPYLDATHITPLQVIQALLPLLRTGPARARDNGKKTIIICLPAIEARVGLPFASMQAMSAASTLRGAEVLRREINLAALTDKSESMKNIKVVVADVGVLDIGIYSDMPPQESVYKSMEDWSPSEKLTYGPAYASISHTPRPPMPRWATLVGIFKHGHGYGIARTPTDVAVFVDKIASVVIGGRHNTYGFGLGHTVEQVKDWIRGQRFSVGAGANTYRIASYLPLSILDVLLNIPPLLVSIRNRLLPIEPFISQTPDISPPPVAPKSSTATTPSSQTISESEHDASENSSEAEVESNASDGVDNSWIRLHEDRNEDASQN